MGTVLNELQELVRERQRQLFSVNQTQTTANAGEVSSAIEKTVRFDQAWTDFPCIRVPRRNVTLASWGTNRLVAIGGWGEDGKWTGAVEWLDLDRPDDGWVELPPVPARIDDCVCNECVAKAIVIRTKLFCFEVQCDHGPGLQGYSLNLSSPSEGWQQLDGTLPASVSSSSDCTKTLAYGSKILFFEDTEYVQESIIYDTLSGEWSQVKVGQSTLGCAASMVAEDRLMVAVMAEEESEVYTHSFPGSSGNAVDAEQERNDELWGTEDSMCDELPSYFEYRAKHSFGFVSNSSLYFVGYEEFVHRHRYSPSKSCIRCDFSFPKLNPMKGLRDHVYKPWSSLQPPIPNLPEPSHSFGLTKIGSWILKVGGMGVNGNNDALSAGVQGLRIHYPSPPEEDDHIENDVTFLHLALQFDRMKLVPFLVDVSPETVGQRDKESGKYPFQIAIEKDFPPQIVRCILRANVDVLVKTDLPQAVYPNVLEGLQKSDGRDPFVVEDVSARNVFRLLRRYPHWFQRVGVMTA